MGAMGSEGSLERLHLNPAMCAQTDQDVALFEVFGVPPNELMFPNQALHTACHAAEQAMVAAIAVWGDQSAGSAQHP